MHSTRRNAVVARCIMALCRTSRLATWSASKTAISSLPGMGMPCAHTAQFVLLLYDTALHVYCYVPLEVCHCTTGTYSDCP